MESKTVPGYATGGIALLKQEALGVEGPLEETLRLHVDGPFLAAGLGEATRAAVRSEWQRQQCWADYECPERVATAATPTTMRQLLAKCLRDATEKPNLLANRGRGRAKNAPKPLYLDTLTKALSILDTTTTAKQKELSYRTAAYSACSAHDYCTCGMSSNTQVMCNICRNKNRKRLLAHSVRLSRPTATTELGLSLSGGWALVLSGLKPGSPASKCHPLERFIDHRILHVNGQFVAGVKDAVRALTQQATLEVELSFYPRYMTIEESSLLHRQQLRAGRAPVATLRPIIQDRAGSPAAVPNRAALIEKHRVVENAVEAVRRRWHSVNGKRLNLENLCYSTRASFPKIFRLVSESAQCKAIVAKAKARSATHVGIPPRGVFKAEDLRPFYPPLVTSSTMRSLSPEMYKSLTLLEDFMTNPSLGVFSTVVDEEVHGAPLYYDVVKKPIDFLTITNRIKSHLYTGVSQVKRDCDLVWANCRLYNPAPHWLFAVSEQLEAELNALWERKGLSAAGTVSYPPRGRASTTSLPQDKVGLRRLKELLATGVAYSSLYSKLLEKLGPESYEVVSAPVGGTDQLDIVIVLKPNLISEQKLTEVTQFLNQGLEAEQQRTKLARRKQ